MRTHDAIQRDMHDYLPRYYADITVSVNVIDREAQELADMNASIYDVLAQFYVDTATWGLVRWERNLSITTDLLKPLDQRRSVIKSKMRGVGTVTAALIENVAESYTNGDVEITVDGADYTVIITFVSFYGVPANITDLQQAIRDVLPAHLAIDFVFRFTTYTQLIALTSTYADITTYTYDEILNGELT